MSKTISVSFTPWVFEQYLQNSNLQNRSKYIEEMFVKGVNSELGEFQGVQTKAIDAIKQLRAKEEELTKIKLKLASVEARVMTQEKRRAEKAALTRRKAMGEAVQKMMVETLEEGDLR